MSCLNMLDSELESKSSLAEIPSVWSELQEGSCISFVIMDAKDENILALLKTAGVDAAQEINELDNLMKNINTESINMCVEEGDICAAFSPNYKQYYRCIVLKRMKNSFLVRYIDYGNEEEVTELRSLSPDLFRKRTYIVCLKKPNSLSASDFVMHFSNEHELFVKSVNKDFIELSFSYGGQNHSMLCFPWYHIVDSVKDSVNISSSEDNSARRNINPSEHTPEKKSDVQEKDVKCSKSPLNISSKESLKGVQVKSPLSTVGTLKNTSIPKEVEENRTNQGNKSPHSMSRTKNLAEKSISTGCRYGVKIVWINTASELFVQLINDDGAITALTKELNEYCSSVKVSKYMPQKGEIVCCKFAQDGNWYRGLVKNKKGDKFLVFFVDFGNEDFIPDSDIYPLPQKFACPKFSICVSLHEIKNKDLSRQLLAKLLNECWDMEVINADTTPIDVMVYQEDRSLTDFICIKTSGKDRSSLQFRKLYPKVSEVVICHADE
ncbi:Tudor domain-containing protein 1, partial [Stegodyphus mimosarum]